MPTPSLPWDLVFAPVDPPAGVSVLPDFAVEHDRLSVSVTNEGHEVAVPGRLRLTAPCDLPAAGGSLWLHGRAMHEAAFVHSFGQDPDLTYPGHLLRTDGDTHRFQSREVMVISRVSSAQPCLVLGSLDPTRCFVDFELATDAGESAITAVSIVFDLRGVTISPGEVLKFPDILVAIGQEPAGLIARYADETARRHTTRVPDHVPTGWCSWYFFYNRVTEADVLANLAELRQSQSHVDYVQVDDGFQSHTGDWLVPNEKFPSGMKSLADSVRDAGFKPGLWLAPLVLHEDSTALREHPEMALHTMAGDTLFVETWLGRCAVLDCTHPEAEAWLRETVATVVENWGYEYLKLDALAFAAQPGDRVRYHRPCTTAPANLRRGLEIIREAAGDRTFILGCTCQFGPALGLVDAMRVGPDVEALWSDGVQPSVKHAMRLTLQRNWMHNRWWANDPDCLIVRDTETQLSEAETHFLATAIALSGGMIVLSDDLPALAPSRRQIAEALLPPPGVASRPVDPAGSPVASLWRADLGAGRSLVGALNWSDEPNWIPRDALLQPGEVAFDVWGGKTLGMGDRLLQPHEGVLLQVSAPGSGPRVVGDTAHLAYHKLYQRQVSGRIQVGNDLARPRTIAIEARGQVFEVLLAPGEMRWFD